MFARKVEFDLIVNKREEFLRKVRDEVLPILRKQAGFIDMLGVRNEIKVEKALVITLWKTRDDAMKYEKEVFPTLTKILKPYLMTPFVVTPCMVETTISEHFLAAVA
jgi:hypothetical protein